MTWINFLQPGGAITRPNPPQLIKRTKHWAGDVLRRDLGATLTKFHDFEGPGYGREGTGLDQAAASESPCTNITNGKYIQRLRPYAGMTSEYASPRLKT